MTFLSKLRNFIRDKLRSTREDVETDEQVANPQPIELVSNESNDLNWNPQRFGFYNFCQIFTDGSMQMNGQGGSCFVLHNLTTDHIVYKCYRLNNQITSCISEYAAIYLALNFLISNEVERSYIELYTDVELAPFHLSEACNKQVLGKSKSKINLTLFKEKIRALRASHNVIEIKWIKRNSVLLNQYADRFAKQGSHQNQINFDASTIRV